MSVRTIHSALPNYRNKGKSCKSTSLWIHFCWREFLFTIITLWEKTIRRGFLINVFFTDFLRCPWKQMFKHSSNSVPFLLHLKCAPPVLWSYKWWGKESRTTATAQPMDYSCKYFCLHKAQQLSQHWHWAIGCLSSKAPKCSLNGNKFNFSIIHFCSRQWFSDFRKNQRQLLDPSNKVVPHSSMFSAEHGVNFQETS